MQKNTLKLTWVLLLIGLLCPIEILGQYASPYLNPIDPQMNPATIVWREKSMVSLWTSKRIDETGKPLTQTQTGHSNSVLLGFVGDTFGLKSSLEARASRTTSRYEYVGTEMTTSQIIEIFDKTGGFAIGPLAIGYTDVNEFNTNLEQIKKTSNYFRQATGSGKFKEDRKGLSLKLTNFFIGVSQKTTSRTDMQWDITQTNYSDSSVTKAITTFSDYVKNENTSAIGLILGEENENRFRIEIYSTHAPKAEYIVQTTNLSDGTSSSENASESESKINSLILDVKINGYFYMLGYEKGSYQNAGTSSGKAFEDSTTQRFRTQFGTTFGENFLLNIYFDKKLEIQRYIETPDEYKSYGLTNSYGTSIGYFF